MAITTKNLQLLRSDSVYDTLALAKAALLGITKLGTTNADGTPVVARYKDGTATKSLLGIAHATAKNGDCTVSIVGGVDGAVTSVKINGESTYVATATTEGGGISVDLTINGETLYLTASGSTPYVYTNSASTVWEPGQVTTSDTIASASLQIEENLDKLAGVVGHEVVYDTTTKKIYLKNAKGNKIGEGFDASVFIKDGMIDTVAWSTEQGKENVLIITWNTDAGKTATELDFSKFIDLYDTDNVNVGSAFTTTTYPTDFTDASAITVGESTSSALHKVEGTISALATEVIENELVTEKAVEAICESAGIGFDSGDTGVVIAYNTEYNANTNYIKDATSLANADILLDAAIKQVESEIEDIELDTDSVVVGEQFTEITYVDEFKEEGAINVEKADTTSVAINKVETSISALSQVVIDNEEVTYNAVKEICESGGLGMEMGESGIVITYNTDYNQNTNYIKDSESLAEADALLDAAIKTVDNKINNIELNTDKVNVGPLFETTEYQEEFTGATAIAIDDTTSVALNKVETTIKSLADELMTDEVVNENAVKEICESAGLGFDSGETGVVIAYNTEYVKNTQYISGATSLAEADVLLDNAIKQVASKTDVTFTEIEYQQDLIDYGGENVAEDDTIAVAVNKIETSISALTEAVIDDEEVSMNAIKAMCESAGIGFDSGDTGVVIEYNTAYNTNTNYIKDADSLANADVLLDAAIKQVENELDDIVLDTDSVNVGANFVATEYQEEFTGATSIAVGETTSVALNKVETTIKALADEVLSNEEVSEKAIEDICEASGLGMEDEEGNTVIVYNTDYVKNTNYISGATSLAEADVLLDNAIKQATSHINVQFTEIEYQEVLINEGAINVAEDDTIAEAVNKVETSISALTKAVIDDEEVTKNAVKEICEAAGLGMEQGDNGVVIAYNSEYNQNTTYIKNSESLAESDALLDAAIKSVNSKVDNINVNIDNDSIVKNSSGELKATYDFGIWG